jgi:type IV pilus modification protein PilV
MKRHTQDTECGRNRNESGFTLIEVLLAISIFTIGMLALGLMQISSIDANGDAKRITEAVTLAIDQMEKNKVKEYADIKSQTRTEGTYEIDLNVVNADSNNDGEINSLDSYKYVEITVTNTQTKRSVFMKQMVGEYTL